MPDYVTGIVLICLGNLCAATGLTLMKSSTVHEGEKPFFLRWRWLAGFSFLGVLTSIWAEKFDHAAAVTNFVIAPLSLLSGTFYSVDRLAPAFRAFSHANPFFYIISGFRYGFLGTADSPIMVGSIAILAVDVVLGVTCYVLLRKGWKLKN